MKKEVGQLRRFEGMRVSEGPEPEWGGYSEDRVRGAEVGGGFERNLGARTSSEQCSPAGAPALIP